MAKILITGSSGFLGSEVIRQAVAQGHEVTALKRATSNVGALEGLRIRWAVGDVTDAASLVDALKGQEYCIHTAGDTSYLLKDRSRLERVNVEGARNIATAAKAAGVKRLVHTSSVAAVGYDPSGREATEDQVWNWPGGLPYMETKRDGERLVLAMASPGFEVVALNPATIFGPGKMNASEEQLLHEVRTRKVPMLPSGGMTVCDVSDVAAAHLAALEKGVSGKRYILGGTSLSHGELMAAFARAFDVPLTEKKAPDWLLAVAGGAMLACERIGIPTGTPSAMIRLARIKIYHSSEKAKSELGYRPRPLDELISRVVEHQRKSSASH